MRTEFLIFMQMHCIKGLLCIRRNEYAQWLWNIIRKLYVH